MKQTNWKILVAYTAHKIVNSVESMQGWRLYRISNNTYSFRRKQEVSCKHKEQVSFLLFRWQILKVYTLLLRFHLAVNRGTAWVGLLERATRTSTAIGCEPADILKVSILLQAVGFQERQPYEETAIYI